MFRTVSIAVGLISVCFAASNDQSGISYSPCPLLGAYYPPPTISKSSDAVQSLAKNLTQTFDQLIQNKGSDKFGPITPDTTSFSVILFTGAGTKGDPTFFEYYYTAPKSGSNVNLTAATKMPVGDLTMIFTVYAWLAKMGDQWDTPITKFLPELKGGSGSFKIPWDDITVGALAGQLSGLPRESNACVIGKPCNYENFVQKIAHATPVFLPDTTPVVSYAAFQLLAFAIQKSTKSAQNGFEDAVESSIVRPLHLTDTGFLGDKQSGVFRSDSLNLSQPGEPAALALTTSTRDLARVGNSILSAQLVSAASTRRWLHPNTDTSNLRNGVGRPWEVYRAASSPISPILDLLTKSGTLGPFASYFGLSTDLNVGFAILAHDSSVASGQLDLNVYADIVSEASQALLGLAAQETAARFAGLYQGAGNSSIALNISKDGPGLEVQSFQNKGTDVRQVFAKKLGIASSDLDFRLYPTNVQSATEHQFVAVFQDKSALVDGGTPTCITWEGLGATTGVAYRYVFGLSKDMVATTISAPELNTTLARQG